MGPPDAARVSSAGHMSHAWQRIVLWFSAPLTAVAAAIALVLATASRRAETYVVQTPVAEAFALAGLLGAGMLMGYGLAARLMRWRHSPADIPDTTAGWATATAPHSTLLTALWEHPQLAASVDSLLAMVGQLLRPHGIVLLRACAEQSFVVVKAWPPDLFETSGALRRGAHHWDQTVVQQLHTDRRALTLRRLARSSRQLPYYNRTPVLRDLLLAPIHCGTHLTAILAVDRERGRIFKASEVSLVQHAANQIGLALELQTALADQAAAAEVNAKLLQRMERMAVTDGLTGLTNHRQFQATFATQLARAERYGRKLSLILADIDHFKHVNDAHGHLVGDKVLRRIAAILRGSARCTDVVARYGGEEFAILMEETNAHGARCIGERIRHAVAMEPFTDDHGTFHTTLSLGVATFPLHGTDKEHLISCADQALYQAKRSGRNQTIIFDVNVLLTSGNSL